MIKTETTVRLFHRGLWVAREGSEGKRSRGKATGEF
jgi:hypothetical protein